MVYAIIKGTFWVEGIQEPIVEEAIFYSEEEMNKALKDCCSNDYLLSFGNLKIMMKKIIAYKFEEENL